MIAEDILTLSEAALDLKYGAELPGAFETLGKAMDVLDGVQSANDLRDALTHSNDGADFLVYEFINVGNYKYVFSLYGENFVWSATTHFPPDLGIQFPYDPSGLPSEGYWQVALNQIGTKVSMKETQGQQKLYLHVYDSSGLHVGLNYATNKIEMQIPGSYYTDFSNTITIFLPENVSSFYYVVDAKYAESPTESYTLTTSQLNGSSLVYSMTSSRTIEQNQKQQGGLCYLNVKSQYGVVSGAGWYEIASLAHFSVRPLQVSIGPFVSKVFIGWTGNIQSRNGSCTLVMDSSKTITAVWSTSYTELILVVTLVIVLAVAATVAIIYSAKKKPLNWR